MTRTISDAYLDLRNELRARGVIMPQLEARELLVFALGGDRKTFNERSMSYIFDTQMAKIDELKGRLFAGEPLAHIIGEWDFYSLTFRLSDNVLVPRPDTETLVDVGIEFFKDRDRGRILDLCCGCGCIGVSLLKNLPSPITAVLADMSDDAIDITKSNIADHSLTFRAITVKQNALEPCPSVLGKFNLIVSNPPYIGTQEIETLDDSVKKYEPRMALDGGDDGLDFYRAISKNYKSALNVGGMLAFECGLGQFEDVRKIIEDAGFGEINVTCDLAGIERVVSGRKII